MTPGEVLRKYKTVAVYGMSRNAEKAAFRIPAFLMDKGYDVIPVNPAADEILGRRCYRSLAEVAERIEVLNVFRPSAEAAGVVKEAVERRRERGDIEVIWLQDGIVSDEAGRLARAAGIEFIEDRCMYREYVKEFSGE